MNVETGRVVTGVDVESMAADAQADYVAVPRRHSRAALVAAAVSASMFDAPGGAGDWARSQQRGATKKAAKARKRERQQRKAGQRAAKRGRT